MSSDNFIDGNPSNPIEVREGHGVYLVRQGGDRIDTTVVIAKVNTQNNTRYDQKRFTLKAGKNVLDTGIRGPVVISAWRETGSDMVTVTTKVPEMG